MNLQSLLLHILSCLSLLSFSSQTNHNQSQFFDLMQQSFTGNSLKNWKVTGNSFSGYYCSFDGVSCNGRGAVVGIDITGWLLMGKLPIDICTYLPELRSFRASNNKFSGGFPSGILNCSYLEELSMNSVTLRGTLPDFSSLKSLRILDLSWNLFSGEFPLSVTNLTELEVLNLNENPGLDRWVVPEDILRLKKLRCLILTTCSVMGQIPAFLSNLTSLEDLELSGNFLVGQIPAELGKLENLQLLELYYNLLTGIIPEELGNLTRLRDVDLSVNKLVGSIPENIFALPNLQIFHAYNNSLTGNIPEVIGKSTTLVQLSLYGNLLTGKLPKNLGKSSEFFVLDVSENNFTGELPPEICRAKKLVYFLILQNQFSGEIPESYGNCHSLYRFRVSKNRLSGKIPEGLFGLPHVSIIDLGFNNFESQIPETVGKAWNLSELYMENNRIFGTIPTQISGAKNMVKLDLSNNYLTGSIPNGIGDLKKLNLLLLQQNNLNSSIPDSLSTLKFLNVLNLSNNLLTGTIPESFCKLLPNSLYFSNNQLSGPVPLALIKGGLAESFSGNPALCVSEYPLNSSNPILPLCSQPRKKQRLHRIWVIGFSAIVVVLGIFLLVKRRFGKERVVMEEEFSSSSSSFAIDLKSFHKLNFDHHEILESLEEKNIIGHGGSGAVYKIQLSNGESIAVKKLWTRKTKNPSPDQCFLDRELKSEVETLGSIRHKNIVKLYCCFSNPDSNFLVYEFMPNGNLWDALHRGITFLDWPTRHRIALGIAQGLSYLHHDLLPPIIHRDIKSTNILLDADFHPKVADFGVAKVLLSRGGKDSTTTVIAGTYGYLAPEYAYSSKATTKCDIYSFGVVLMELITGRKPIDAEFGENKNIILWISRKLETKDGVMEVLDKRLSESFKAEMIQMLRIAIRCTLSMPTQRPTMNDVVQMLIEASSCRFESFKSSNKIKELPTTKTTTTN